MLVSLQAALGRPLKASFSRLQSAVMSRTSLDLGDPKNIPYANGGLSGEPSVIKRLPENYVMSVHYVSLATIDRNLRKIGMKWSAKRRPKLTPKEAASRLEWTKECENWLFGR